MVIQMVERFGKLTRNFESFEAITKAKVGNDEISPTSLTLLMKTRITTKDCLIQYARLLQLILNTTI